MFKKYLFPLTLFILALAACAQAEPTATPQATDLPPEPAVEASTRPALGPAPATAEAAEQASTPAPLSEEQMTAEAREVLPTAEPQPGDDLDVAELITADMLANMTFSSDWAADGSAPLVDGQYSEQAAPGSATETTIWLTDHIAYGELGGQPAVAVVLVSDPGGSGTFYSLHIVGLENGLADELASAPLGDRVEIDALDAADNQVTVQMVIAGPDDPLCCPTQQVVQIYELQEGELVKTADEAVGIVSEAAAGGIVNRIWGWQERRQEGGDAQSYYDPQKYTLVFNEDGSYLYTADCSPGGGLYSAGSDGAISLQASLESMDDCGPESHSAAMKEGLRQADTFRRENGALSLLWGDDPIVDTYIDLGPAVPDTSDLAIGAEQISLDTQGLYNEWTAVEVPARAVDDSSAPGPRGLPDHIEIYFDYENSAEREGGAIMYIIPVDAYIELYGIAGFDWIAKNIDAIYEFARSPQQPPPTNGVPILPNEEVIGVNDLAVQIAGTGAGQESASQTGYRFMGRSVQDSNPVTNQDLSYIYQGFSNDGKYLVAFFNPVRTDELPDEAGDVSQEATERLNNDVVGYLDQEAQRLNGIPPYDWQPDLAALDALVNSLRIEQMVPAGLQSTAWEWSGQVNDPGGGEVTVNALQGDYSVVYDRELLLSYVADCNLGSSGYELTATGMVGGMRAQPAVSAPIECGLGSFSQEFGALLAAAQAYRVLPGGREMILALPNGGGDYLMREAAGLSAGSEAAVESGAAADETGVGYGSTDELVEKGITLEVAGLVDTYAWTVRPETSIAAQAGGQGLPQHVLITFDGDDPDEVLADNGRRLYIFPTQPYIDIYEEAGRDVVGDQVARLRELIAAAQGRLAAPEGWMPLLPPPDSQMERWAQFRDYDFVDGMGVRYLGDSPFRQSIGVWGNDTTAYYYQGLTEDGRYYVSLWWPVSTEALPQTAEEAPPEVQEMAGNPETRARYVQETKNSLNALPPYAFDPPLAQLDTMVNSLEIGQ